MDIPRVTQLRDFLATLPPSSFDMSIWGTYESCNTAVCIGGWAVRLFNLKQPPLRGLFVKLIAGEKLVADHLGLTEDQADALFYPPNYKDHYYPLQQAVAVLDHLIETGEVDWTIGAGSV